MHWIHTAAARNATRTGFTFMELLIVITIIACLCAMIIPVISLIRDSAYTTQCMSSQRQLGLASVAYAVDHRFYPPVQGNDGRSWHDLISTYIETDVVGTDGQTYAQGITRGTQRRSLFRGCPLVGKFIHTNGWDESKAWGGYGMNYFYTLVNFQQSSYPFISSAYSHQVVDPVHYIYKPALRAAITHPENRILTADSGSWSLTVGADHLIRSIRDIPTNSSDPIFESGQTAIYDRHRGRRVVASYFDGRAAISSFKKTYCALAAPDLLPTITQ